MKEKCGNGKDDSSGGNYLLSVKGYVDIGNHRESNRGKKETDGLENLAELGDFPQFFFSKRHRRNSLKSQVSAWRTGTKL